MGKIENSVFMPWLAFSIVLGIGLAILNEFVIQADFWMILAIVSVAGCVLLFLGKSHEMKWREAGFLVGLIPSFSIVTGIIRIIVHLLE